jgi:hypothetical protein
MALPRTCRGNEMSNRLLEIQAKLLEITHDCRYDMHEPDEQGVKARVIGDHLDNAMGNHIIDDLLIRGSHEFVVVIEREDWKPHITLFNLADLIALARQADVGGKNA